jgi:hypothetical protein
MMHLSRPAVSIKADPDGPHPSFTFHGGASASHAVPFSQPPSGHRGQTTDDVEMGADTFLAIDEVARSCSAAGPARARTYNDTDSYAALEAFMEEAGSPDCDLSGGLGDSFLEEAWGAFAAPPYCLA